MLRSNIINSIVTYLLFFPLTLMAIAPSAVKAQETTPAATSESESSPQQAISILSLEGGKNLMAEADRAIDAQQLDVAAAKLQKARQVFNQLSNFYLQLFNSFSGLDNRVAESQRKKALETGQMRDRATYQLALVHRAQDQPELSVPLLVQIIGSQSATSGLGRKAYQQLNEIGFVDEPLTTPDAASPNTGDPDAVNPDAANPNPSQPTQQ